LPNYTTDIAIIGQGLAGSMLARELWHRGIDFIVIDRGHEHSSSMAAGGLFYPLSARKIKEVEMGAEQFAQMTKTFQEIESELKISILHEIPSLKLFPPEELHGWKQAAEGNLSSVIREIHPRVQHKGLKNGFSGAVIAHSGFVDLPLFLSKMREWLKLQGRLMETDARTITGNTPVILNDLLQAEKVIFCEGPAILSNPDLSSVDIRWSKGEWMEIHAPGLDEGFILRSDIFVLPLGNCRFRVGATFSHDTSEEGPTPTGLAELTSKLEKLVDVPFSITLHKAGIRPTTRDRQPVIGPLPPNPDYLVFNGLGSRGVFQGPWYADRLTRFILTGEKEWPRSSDTGRFF
jgi:glycine oxidase